MRSSNALHDVIVIGGGYAGMAAALQVARARRRVMVIDSARARNRAATALHDTLGYTNNTSSDITAKAKDQLLSYPNVVWRHGFASHAYADHGIFIVTGADTRQHSARRLILASGVVDILPVIPGLKERWGKTVHLSLYSKGYELQNHALGLLAARADAYRDALSLSDWGPVTLFTNGVYQLDPDQNAALIGRGILIEQDQVGRLHGGERDVSVQLADKRLVALDALFVASRTRLANPIAEQLGCRMVSRIDGDYIATDIRKQTSHPGVFACGDASGAIASISVAIGDGASTGIAVHQSLLFD